jgi:tRNA-Thr(GGU) m(6)t(6)A37 methyltransferase TsaA
LIFIRIKFEESFRKIVRIGRCRVFLAAILRHGIVAGGRLKIRRTARAVHQKGVALVSETDKMASRPGEVRLARDPAVLPADAGLVFIGHIETPWSDLSACPRNGRKSDAICRVHVSDAYAEGLKSVATCSHLILLYWMSVARRDLIVQAPSFAGTTHGCFALRSPVRPNPVSLSVVDLLGVDGNVLSVRGLDCLNGTPLVDIKPYFARTDSFPEAEVGWAGG